MGIYIKDVKAPTRCEDCLLCHCMEQGDVMACGCKATMKIRHINCNDKPEWCPIVDVSRHGDLVDRSYLMMFPIRIDHYDEEHGNVHFMYGVETVVDWIEEAQTVIEADTSEEELQREYEANVEYAQYCERYESSYDTDTGSM